MLIIKKSMKSKLVVKGGWGRENNKVRSFYNNIILQCYNVKQINIKKNNYNNKQISK